MRYISISFFTSSKVTSAADLSNVYFINQIFSLSNCHNCRLILKRTNSFES